MEEEKTYPIRLILGYSTNYGKGLTFVYETDDGKANYYALDHYDYEDKITFIDEESTITFSKIIIPAQKGFLCKTNEVSYWELISIKINRNWQKHS